MLRLFNLFLKEKGIDLFQIVSNDKLQDLTKNFNLFQYQVEDKKNKKRLRNKNRRFHSTDRVNKFMIRKWVEKATGVRWIEKAVTA